MTHSTTAAALAVLGLAAGCAPVAILGAGGALTTTVVQERSTLDALNDTDIALGVAQRLGNHSGELFRDVSVDVTEGQVVLTGSVPRAEDRVAASKAAWDTPGVQGVDEALTVAEDSGTLAYLQDVRISNRLRLTLLGDTAIRSVNYSVTTVDGTVHLTGIARSEAELAAVIAHARATPGVVKVVSHALTIADPRRVKRLARGS
ncbi:MAG: BON domain-containing protein [Paracoccaceae bacterium]